MTSTPSNSRSRIPAVGMLVATLIGNLYLIAGTLFFSVIACLLAWVPPRGRIAFWLARVWSRGLLLACGCRLESSSSVRLDGDTRYVFMANHQSLFDIPALLISAPTETRFLAKRSLFRIPFFGWVLKVMGFVSIDRTSTQRGQSAFTAALRELRSGGSILVFPEATRSLDGRLLPFKRGGLLLALRGGLPIVPVGVRGTLAIRSRESYLIRPGRIGVRFGRPLDPAAYGLRGLDRLQADLRTRIAELAGLD